MNAHPGRCKMCDIGVFCESVWKCSPMSCVECSGKEEKTTEWDYIHCALRQVGAMGRVENRDVNEIL